jgi:GT2 family glycosyltransferase
MVPEIPVMQLAPIVLFVYNRPEHTRKTIEALKRNPLAAQSELMIFSDGPKRENDWRKVREVREFLTGVSGFQRISVRESEVNRGLANSIIEGVTSVINEYGRVIVLEDDILTSPYFLTYMNDALEFYAHEEQVMHVSGYMYPVDPQGLGEAFFCPIPSPWGWGTWKRAWRFFKKDVEETRRTFSKAKIYQFNLNGVHNFWEQVQHNWQGKADTWAIFWHLTIFTEKGLCLTPSHSMTQNIGHDGTGVHCLQSREAEAYMTNLSQKAVTNFPDEIVESSLALSRIKDFFPRVHISRFKRLILVLQKKWHNWFS